MNASDLEPQSKVSTLNGGVLTVKSVKTDPKKQDTFNFEVADYHTYFVGKKGVWVHNACGPKNVPKGAVKFDEDTTLAAGRLGFDAADVSIKSGVADIPIIFTSSVSLRDISKVTMALKSQGATSAKINTGPIINDTISSRIEAAYKSGRKFSWFTNQKYSSEASLRSDLAIRSDWGINITSVSTFRVPKGLGLVKEPQQRKVQDMREEVIRP